MVARTPTPLHPAVVERARRLAYPVPEAAEQLGISVSSTWELISSGQLESVKIAGRRLVPHDVLVGFVEAAKAAG